MQLRTPARERSTAVSGSGSTAVASRRRRFGRHLLTAAGLLAFTYAALRVLGSRDDVPVQSVDEVRDNLDDAVPDDIQSRAVDAVPGDRSIDTIRNRAGGTVPDDITQISIDGPRSDESEREPDIESPTETDEPDGDVIDETETNADYTDERSDEEIAERAEPDVQGEPAEPGEMAVDEDVAEDLVDTDIDTDADSKDETTDSESESDDFAE
ncbi:hypothetical protein [Natrinema sp. SYSU A 869]|uniref:hypothetical protein n=1 Tax=Natrinema sp. SYSU A 869 TaxID=2871694 RepID=UPI001CA42992|nr:hypothetical protein [Natrinema sp. SYSU A 869]